MKRHLLLLFLAMGLLLVGCATHRNIETATAYDYPPRWVAYALHPVGWFLDVTVAGPITGFACSVPEITGCTPNDELAIKGY